MSGDIAVLGIKAPTGDLVKAQAELRKMPAATKVAETAMQRLENSLDKTLAGVNAKLDLLSANTKQSTESLVSLAAGSAPASAALAKIDAKASGTIGVMARLRASWNETLASFQRSPSAGDATFIGPLQKEVKNVQLSTSNLAAQFNDIGVTAAMGMSPLMIALQQGTQLMQAFIGMKPSAVFKEIGGAIRALASVTTLLTLAGVAVVAWIAQWAIGFFTAEKETKKLADTVSELTAVSRELATISESYSLEGVVRMHEEFKGLNAQMLILLERKRAFAEDEAFARMGETAASAKLELGEMLAYAEAVAATSQNIFNGEQMGLNVVTLSKMREQLGQYSALLEYSAEQMGLNSAEAIELSQALTKVGKAATFDEAVKDFQTIERLLGKSTKAGSEFHKKILEAWEAVQKLALAAPKSGWLNAAIAAVQPVTDELTIAYEEAVKLNNAAPLASWMNPAMTGVNALIGRLVVAASLAAEVDDAGNVVQEGVSRHNKPRRAPSGEGGIDWGLPDDTGGGGGGASKVLTDLEKINEEIQKLSEPFGQAETAVGSLYDAFENGIISQDRYASTMERIKNEFIEAGGTAAQFAKILDGVGDKSDDLTEKLKDLGENALNSVGDEIATLAVDGKANFGDLAKSIVKDLIKMALQAAITKPLMSWLGFSDGDAFGGGTSPVLANATGNAFDRGVKRFASGGDFTNSVVSKATPFSYGGGSLGVMGEAGPEAILPLKRGSDGSLGVQMHGNGKVVGGDQGGAKVTVNVYNMSENSTVREESSRDADGNEIRDIIIETVNEGFGNGDFDDANDARYGAKIKKRYR